jgi:hypothetical protein
VIEVPSAPPAAKEADDLYALAPDDPLPPETFSKSAPIAAPEPAARPPAAGRATGLAAAGRAPGLAAATIPGVIGYQQPIQKQDRFSRAALMDARRDIHLPTACLIVGFLLYIGYYMFRYSLSGSGIAIVLIGLSVMIAFKAALLIGFAFAVSGPLGVSFGGIWTAIFKLAAIAVFCDGCTTWVDYGVDKLVGAAGGFGYMISFPVSLGIYWLLLIHLFDMDAGDSWLVVILLAVFSAIVRWVLLILLLSTILNWGGVAAPALAFGGGGNAVAANSPFADDLMAVQDLKERKLLQEARERIADGREVVVKQHVEDWYAAGAKNVWFSLYVDVERKVYAGGVIVELPTDKDARAKCYQIIQDYNDTMGWPTSPSDLVDNGAPYLFLGLD